MAQPHVLVIGDLILDCYLFGASHRISPEAPVPVVNIQDNKVQLGGAGNVAFNLHSLGAKVTLISVLGNDDTAKSLTCELDKLDITLFAAYEDSRISPKKTRVLAAHQQMLRMDQESCFDLSQQSQQKLLQYLESIITNVDTILLSDYGKGSLSQDFLANIIKLGRSFNKMILVDPNGLDYNKYKGASLLTPNKKEAEMACGFKLQTLNDIQKACYLFKKNLDLKFSMITLSEDGIALLDDDNKFHHIKTQAREVYDVTGAGDTVIAVLSYFLSLNKDFVQAAKLANKAAALTVAKLGSTAVSLNDILIQDKNIEDKIKNPYDIKKISQDLKDKQKTIIFTNGCFDLLHKGHIAYLRKSKQLGDILIVGLNADVSVQSLKGKNRPFQNQDDRAFMLANFDFIDYVVIFTEVTPLDLIKAIKPDIITKGKDYEGKTVVGSEFAKQVLLIDLKEGYSSTKIAASIQAKKC